MRHSTKIGIKIGAKTGIASVIGYAMIDTLFNNVVIIIVWHPSFVRLLQGLSLDFINSMVFLIIPFAVICSITGGIFSKIAVANPNLSEKGFAGVGTFISLTIALLLHTSTANIIYNINPDTMFRANLEYRTIPYTLFVIWGYFISRKIYRAIKLLSDGKASPA